MYIKSNKVGFKFIHLTKRKKKWTSEKQTRQNFDKLFFPREIRRANQKATRAARDTWLI